MVLGDDPVKENFEKLIGSTVKSIEYNGKYSEEAYASNFNVRIIFDNGHIVTGGIFADEGDIGLELNKDAVYTEGVKDEIIN